ncbi:winged helix-turn-helix domain-containing protein [Mycobacterium sp. MMS18-G62]
MYQAAAPPSRPPVNTVRVVLVLDVPAGSPELPSRTAQLADEFGRLIAHSVPGVRARKSVVSVGPQLAAAAVRAEGLTIDVRKRDVRIDGRPLRLTYREFELLCYLASVPRRPVSRAELMREVWHDRAPGSDVSFRTVDTHVRRLRAKLDAYASVLTTVRGRGYRFDPRPDVHCLAADLGACPA